MRTMKDFPYKSLLDIPDEDKDDDPEGVIDGEDDQEVCQ